MSVDKNTHAVTVERELAATPTRVFAALKEGRLFFNCGAWPQSSKIDFKVGGKYRFDWGHHGSTYGEFTEIVENRKVAFTWTSDDIITGSKVTIELAPSGAQSCLLKLRHEGFKDQETAKMHDGGWNGGLTDLTAEITERRVHMEREFLVPVEMLYQACSGAALFTNFGAIAAKSKIDFRIGGRYECELEKGGPVKGEFLAIIPNQKIAFTWEAAPCGVAVEKTTTVTLEFGPWGDGGKNSYLELTHVGFTSDEATLAHHDGWNQIVRKIYDRGSK